LVQPVDKRDVLPGQVGCSFHAVQWNLSIQQDWMDISEGAPFVKQRRLKGGTDSRGLSPTGTFLQTRQGKSL
jgi:hypothetical protein